MAIEYSKNASISIYRAECMARHQSKKSPLRPSFCVGFDNAADIMNAVDMLRVYFAFYYRAYSIKKRGMEPTISAAEVIRALRLDYRAFQLHLLVLSPEKTFCEMERTTRNFIRKRELMGLVSSGRDILPLPRKKDNN
jgi:hypothetical protein